MRATPIEINWNPGLPIFASEPFLKAVGDEYGWLGGFDDAGELRCILPYTVIRKATFRLVRFRVETIILDEGLDIREEKPFLNSSIDFFRSINADMIIPATTNSVFRTYPDGAVVAPYGSYIIDLQPPEEVLWHNIERITRQNIKTAVKKGVEIRTGQEHLKSAYDLIRFTFKRSRLPFMDIDRFESFVKGLGENCIIMKAEHENSAQSYVVFAFSDFCAYAIYAGNVVNQISGANKLLYWEAIKMFKKLGVRKYDFVGTRINPEEGSKQAALATFKRHFGAELIQGFIWKYPLNKLRYSLYCLAARLRSGGDIVDTEKHKMQYIETKEDEDKS